MALRIGAWSLSIRPLSKVLSYEFYDFCITWIIKKVFFGEAKLWNNHAQKSNKTEAKHEQNMSKVVAKPLQNFAKPCKVDAKRVQS